MKPSDEFTKNKYVMVPFMISSPEILRKIYEYTLKKANENLKFDSQVPNTPSFYCDPVMESLLKDLLPKMESFTGLKLFPTYSYFRIYKGGDILEKLLRRNPIG